MKLVFSVILLCGYLMVAVHGHGMLLQPPNRSSIWRSDKSFPANYEDNQLFCGGFQTQFNLNGGKCGVCGDNYADPRPRANEIGGQFGLGAIVGTYREGGTLPAAAYITANHLGYFYFKLCDYTRYGETEECFEQYQLTNAATGADKHYLTKGVTGWYNVTLQLPAGLACDHCVLQWTYNTGNSWGTCDDGTGAIGCGAQEHFRTCSDVQIVRS